MTAIVWFRQDLRIQDNPALTHACNEHEEVIFLYIKEPNSPLLLGRAQGWWLHHSLKSLNKALTAKGNSLWLKTGDALSILTKLIKSHGVTHVYWNRCYEPLLNQRDELIKAALEKENKNVTTFNRSLLIEPLAIKNQENQFYKVFTPFWKQCLNKIAVSLTPAPNKWPEPLKPDSEQLEDWKLLPTNPDWAFQFGDFWTPGEEGAHRRFEQFIEDHLDQYKEFRDYPEQEATSRLSPHLHFGEISPHQIWIELEHFKTQPHIPVNTIEKFISEIGWREFSYYLLNHFPKLEKKNFQSKFDDFPWKTNKEALHRWQTGRTGYPIVDAGMKELWSTGYMHNRVRMITASFLTKDLLIDWRKGADWFLDTLLDADLACNSANWQWVAGSGADAAPYFRIFNPVTQGEKFDPKGLYVKRWLPELKSLPSECIHKPWTAKGQYDLKQYPPPIVDHSHARKLALQNYKEIS